VLVNADAGSPDGTQRVVVDTEPPDYIEQILLVRPKNKLQRISLTYPEVNGVGGKGAALRTIFGIADALKVQALVVVDSDLRSIVPEWIELLAGPIIKGGFDFVAPLYSRYKYDGTITNTVTYPLTRALYGLRIRQPIGGDFGVSGDLIRHYLEQDDWTPDISKFGIDIWMTTSAISGGFAVCQTRLGAKVHDPKDPGADLGPMFSQVVSTILRLTERHAERWLEVQSSHDIPVYGFERIIDPPPLDRGHPAPVGTVRGRRHHRRVHLGAGLQRRRTTRRWSGSRRRRRRPWTRRRVPTSRCRSSRAGFHFPDELWARLHLRHVRSRTGTARRRPSASSRHSCPCTSDGWPASSSRRATSRRTRRRGSWNARRRRSSSPSRTSWRAGASGRRSGQACRRQQRARAADPIGVGRDRSQAMSRSRSLPRRCSSRSRTRARLRT
jgi:hypothetical protein